MYYRVRERVINAGVKCRAKREECIIHAALSLAALSHMCSVTLQRVARGSWFAVNLLLSLSFSAFDKRQSFLLKIQNLEYSSSCLLFQEIKFGR